MKTALPLFKLLHLLGAMGFVGGTAAQWVLARGAQAQLAAKAVAGGVAGPALLLMIASGMVLVALRPALLEQRWMWAKLLLTMVIAPAAWFGAGIGAVALALGLSVAAAAIAVWRPRWGQSQER